MASTRGPGDTGRNFMNLATITLDSFTGPVTDTAQGVSGAVGVAFVAGLAVGGLVVGGLLLYRFWERIAYSPSEQVAREQNRAIGDDWLENNRDM